LRLFIAVVPPEPVLQELLAVVAPLRAAHAGLAWSDPADWHCTLAFLGEVPDKRRTDLSEELAHAASGAGRFDLRIAGSGDFGDRVVWAGVTGDLDSLQGLADTARTAAGDAQVEHDPEPFQPHLTMAYAGSREGAADEEPEGAVEASDLQPVIEVLADFRSSPWNVDRLLLMSAESGRSPRYATEESWPLAGDPR
jgi:2'-5' RNA ligase